MNIQEVAAEHPELLAAILAASSGPLGEILVARALRSRGCKVSVLSNNWRQRDLQVVTANGRTVFVETKTVRQKGSVWIVNSEPDPERSQFWILVYAPRLAEGLPRDEDVRFFVLTCEEAIEAWRRSSPAVNINASIRGDIRWHNLPKDCEGAFFKFEQ
jgi:hypothetical protein